MPATILFCSQTCTPIGGVETWLDILCRNLPRTEWRPVVALVRGARFHQPEVWSDAHPGLQTVEIDGRGLKADDRIRAVMRCIRRIQPNIFVPVGVVDAHDAICRLKMEGFPARLVMAVHGNTPALIADLARYKDFADLVVCPGALTRRLVVEGAGVRPEIAHHVPHGMTPPKAQRRPRRMDEPIRLGFVGRLVHDDKRVLDLIPVCRRLSRSGIRFSLDIVGEGECRSNLERGLRESMNTDRIRFRGRLSLDELYAQVYPSLDCLLHFSAAEAFGIALTEAMVHGVVPVASRFVGHESEGILRHEETCLLFEVGDMDGAAACVGRLVEQPTLWEALSQQAEATVSRAHTWKQTTQIWSRLLEKVLDSPPFVGERLPLKSPGPPGRLDVLGLPPVLIDVARSIRRRLVGLPEAMIGGEEWPFVNKDHNPRFLGEIDLLARNIDRRESKEEPSC